MRMVRPTFETSAVLHETSFCSARPDVYIEENAGECDDKAWYVMAKMTYPDGTTDSEPISGPYPTLTQASSDGTNASKEWLRTHAARYERIMQ